MQRILVVEDDPEQLAIRCQILQHAGYDVAAAQSASEAIEKLPGCSVVVMDLRIPTVEDGVRLIDAVNRSARIVVLSGGEPDQALPIDEFLGKPCSSKKLIEVIAKFAPLAPEA